MAKYKGTTGLVTEPIATAYHKIPAVSTANRPGEGGGVNAHIPAANGMIIYNSTLGSLQQYSAGTWQVIASETPTISSFVYSDGASATAENPAGGGVITITGTNYDSVAGGSAGNIAVTFGGTTATSISVNSLKTVITCTVPAKAAGTVVLLLTNASGATAETNFIYDAEPAWTATGSLGSFIDKAYTNSSSPTIRIQAAEGGDTITYAQTNSAGVVNTTGVQGLTLGTGLGSGANSPANAGYLTGTLSASEGTTYPFYAKATDAENQVTAPTLFNIISAHLASGGNETSYSGYKVHSFLANGTFTLRAATTCSILIIGAGGGGAGGTGGGGGGGAVLYGASIALDARDYVIVRGTGGAAGTLSTVPEVGIVGQDSTFTPDGGSVLTVTAKGGGGGNAEGGNSAVIGANSGGGTNATYPPRTPPSHASFTGYSVYAGYIGGAGTPGPWDTVGGGGGAGAVGGASTSSRGGLGGAGRQVGTIYDGSTNYYWGGGGGGPGTYTHDGGNGGIGGGGGGDSNNQTDGTGGAGFNNGAAASSTGGAGGNYTGGGGGGGFDGSAGGAGGHGLVMIRYAV